MLTAVAGKTGGNAAALEYAAEHLRKNRKFVLSCVKMNGGALWFASDELKQDREIALASETAVNNQQPPSVPVSPKSASSLRSSLAPSPRDFC